VVEIDLHGGLGEAKLPCDFAVRQPLAHERMIRQHDRHNFDAILLQDILCALKIKRADRGVGDNRRLRDFQVR
jgi:hypothetical protein